MLYGVYVHHADAWYVGQTKDLRKRLAQHRSRPPRTLARALLPGTGPGAQFSCDVLDRVGTQHEADRREAELIAEMGTLNDLPGPPTGSRRGWTIMMARSRSSCR